MPKLAIDRRYQDKTYMLVDNFYIQRVSYGFLVKTIQFSAQYITTYVTQADLLAYANLRVKINFPNVVQLRKRHRHEF